jgi:hypothetical protein
VHFRKKYNAGLNAATMEEETFGSTDTGREKGSAKVVEVEIHGNGITLRGSYVDAGFSGGKVFGGEIKLESGANESAAAVTGAKDSGLARRREGSELLILAEDLNVEIFPEVVRARSEAGGRAGT